MRCGRRTLLQEYEAPQASIEAQPRVCRVTSSVHDAQMSADLVSTLIQQIQNRIQSARLLYDIFLGAATFVNSSIRTFVFKAIPCYGPSILA